MPDEETRIFATTQLVDEARHTVFFARFFKEVLGVDKEKLEDALAIAREYMNTHLKYILIDTLSEVAARIQREPGNLAYLIEGITLYHVIIEGTMALAGQRGILEFYRMNNLFPAFRGGFTAVARDESRHVVFGVKFLREMIQKDPNNAMIVHDAVEKYAPIAFEGIYPAPDQLQIMLANGDDPWMTPRYAQESLAKKLKVMGLSMKLPVVPPMPLQGM
jgi:ribonucleoside-diphosphate reductase beta chain